MSTAMISTAVMNISMNTAWAEFIPCCRKVLEKHQTVNPARFQASSEIVLDAERSRG